MPVVVDIADRLYDYTDEEKAAEAVAEYQAQNSLNDAAIIAIWADENDPRRIDLEKIIFDAVDANGSMRRAQEHIPNGVELALEPDF